MSTWNKLRILFLEIKVSKQNFVSKYNIIFVKIIIKNLNFDFEKIFLKCLQETKYIIIFVKLL